MPALTEEEEDENQFSGMTSFKKKDEGKPMDHINTKFYVATEVRLGLRTNLK